MSNPEYRRRVYKQRTLGFAKKVVYCYKLTTEEFMENANFYGKKARKEGVIAPNSGLSKSTLLKYGISKEDLRWENF
jgi:hypothetical protein